MGRSRKNKRPIKRVSRKRVKKDKKGGFFSSIFGKKTEDEIDDEANQIMTENYQADGGDINLLSSHIL